MKPLTLLACAAVLALPACLVTIDDEGLEVHGWDEWDEVMGDFDGHGQVLVDGHEVEVGDDAVRVDGVLLRHRRWVELAQAAEPGAGLDVSVGSGPVLLDAAPGGLSLSVLLWSEHAGDGGVALEDGRLVARGGRGRVFLDGVRGTAPADTLVRASSGTGEVRLVGFSGASLRASSGTGSLVVMCCDARAIQLETGTGALSVQSGAPHELRASSGTGEVRLDGLHAETVHASTGTGDIHVRLCQIGRLQADSGTGDVSIDGGRIRELHHELGTGAVDVSHGTELGG